jgi:hypothetical protein
MTWGKVQVIGQKSQLVWPKIYNFFKKLTGFLLMFYFELTWVSNRVGSIKPIISLFFCKLKPVQV